MVTKWNIISFILGAATMLGILIVWANLYAACRRHRKLALKSQTGGEQ